MQKKLVTTVALFLLIFVIFFQAPSSKEILLGQTCALSGPAGILGRDARDGALAYFNHINTQGGIKGKNIRLITLDDKYEPDIAEKNSIELVKKGVFAFFGVVGTPTAVSSLGVARAHDKLFLTPFTGAAFLRSGIENVVNFRACYEMEAHNIIEYLVETRKLKKIAILYQNDAFGSDGSWGVKKALKMHSLKESEAYSFNRNTLSFDYALENLSKSKPEAIVIIAPYQPCAEFIKRARKSGLHETTFCAFSFVHSQELKNALGKNLDNIIVSEVVPSYMDDSISASKLYRDVFRKYFPDRPYSRISFEGFLSAMYISKAIANTNGKVSNRAILSAFKTFDHMAGVEVKTVNNKKSIHNTYLNFLDRD